MKDLLPESFAFHPEADTFNFKNSIDAIKVAVLSHKLFIASVTFVTIVLVVIVMMLFPPVYQASVTVIAESETDIQRAEFYNHWNIFRKNSLSDEGQLLTSGIVVGRLVDEMGLTYDDVYHTFMGHIGHLWVNSSIGKAYRSVKFRIFPPAESPYQLTEEELERGKTINSFKEGVVLDTVPDTNLGVVVVKGPSPRVADMANGLLEIFMDVRKERLLSEAQTAYDSLENEVKNAREELVEVEMQLETFFEENEMLLAYEKDKVQVTTWLGLQTQIVELESQLAALESSLRTIDEQLANEDKEIITGRLLKKNSAYEMIWSQIVQLNIQLEQVRVVYSENSSEVRDVKQQITALEKLLESENQNEEVQSTSVASEGYLTLSMRRNQLQSEIEGIKSNLAVKKKAEHTMGSELENLPEKMNLTRKLEREYQIIEKKYIALSDKLMIAAVSLATINSAPVAIQLVNSAVYPEKASWPNKKLLLLGALVFGISAGIAGSLLIDYAYGNITRYRFNEMNEDKQLYAIVSKDREFVSRVFGLPHLNESRDN